MKTVPTIVASSSAVAASALGLAFARQDSRHESNFSPAHLHPRAPSRRTHSAPLLDMTSAATCTLNSPDALSSPRSVTLTAADRDTPLRPDSRSTGGPSRARTPNYAEPELQLPKRTLKRSQGSRNSTPMTMESAWATQETESPNEAAPSQGNWFKRLSTFSSNDGSIMSSNRPHSVAISQSNGSVAFSNAGSTTPIFPSFSPAPVPPNKLVKRTSSVRSTRGSSRIPLPTFKKPATSHERDALQRRPSTATLMSFADPTEDTAESPLRSYFSPKISITTPNTLSRRASTSIPNPIKRITPDRKYHPILVSGGHNLRRASVELERPSIDQERPVLPPEVASSKRISRRFFSAPLPQRPGTASTNTSASVSRLSKTEQLKRNFSLSKRNSFAFQGSSEPFTGTANFESVRPDSPAEHAPAPLPKWKRPTKLRASESKNPNKAVRTSSATTSIATEGQEPPSKRREVSTSAALTTAQQPLAPSPGDADTQQGAVQHAATDDGPISPSDGRNDSPTPTPHVSFQPRQTSAQTEFTSSFAESDTDGRFFDDDGFDSANDTLFDSIRTRATSASSTGFKGPRIDAIFDKPIDKLDSGYHSPKFPRDTFEGLRHSVIEEEENMPTPVRSQRNGASPDDGTAFGSSPAMQIPSSPPIVPRILRRKPSVEFSAEMQAGQENWDFGEEGQSSPWGSATKFPAFDDDANDAFSASPFRTPAHGQADARSNIFDWSEQQAIEKSPAGKSPPRPKTVHGKKDADNRGSRTAGRRVPSGFHARSQSVPVVPELDGKRSVATSKFGTWGVGSKGVTEDWNEDFDFEETSFLAPQPNAGVRHVSDGMQVPKAIQERQINVLANIGLLRDWGLLIEELKELRARAQMLHLRDDLTTDAVWHEVDAMIDLADQESNDHTLDPRQSPPSSPTFDDSAFDDPALMLPMRNSPRVIPKVRAEDIWESPTPSPARKVPGTPDQLTPRRPRKDSEAVARSVIEALQQRRNNPDPSSEPDKVNKKVPFDTATLRRIVPYVQELRDKVKRSIREAEGLNNSPRAPADDENVFEKFRNPPESPSVRKAQRRSITKGSREISDNSLTPSPPEDIARRLELMTMG